jgi:hypothetical protein
LLAAEARVVAQYGARTALARQTVTHGDTRRFAFDRQVKLPAAACGVSGGHGSAPRLLIGANWLNLWYNQIALKFFEQSRQPKCRAPVARKGRVQRQAREPMIDSSRRTVLATGAAAAAASVAPQVFAQAQPAAAVTGLPAGAKVGFYNAGTTVWAKEMRERRPDVTMETIEKYLHNLYRVGSVSV